MANSGSFNTSSYTGSTTRYLTFNWWVNGQDVGGNYTDIGWNLVGAGGNSTWYKSGNFKVIIDGNQEYYSSTRIELSNGTVVASGTKRIWHNADGNRSFSAYAEAGIYTNAVNCTGSGSWDLPYIARASTPSCITWPNTTQNIGKLGDTITIHMNRASTSFDHCVYFSFGNIKNQLISGGIGDNVQWTIPKDLANQIPNGDSGTGEILCETYYNGSYIGYKTISFTVSIPNTDEFKPTISEIALSEAVGGIFANFEAYIQNQSKAYCTITAAGAYSSTIKSYKAVVNGATYNEKTFTTDFLKLSGTNSVVVTVTDTRGRTTTLTREFEVLAYEGPSITKFIANRCTEDGTLDDEGEFAKIEIAAVIPSLNNKNGYSYYLQYRDTDEDEYTLYNIELIEVVTDTTITISGSTIIAADGDNSFDYMFAVADAFIPRNKLTGVDTVFQLINFRASGKGLAFGKVSEKDAFEVNMEIYDRFGQLINNGLAEYGYNENIDPNNTLSTLIITEANTPNNNGFYYIMTLFYGEKSVTARRTQIAIPYIYDISQSKREIFIRQNVDGAWNDWTQI